VAHVLEKLGVYLGAETLLKRAVSILEKKLGRDHPNTAIVVSNLARVLDSQGKFAATIAPSATAKPPAGGAKPAAAPAGSPEAVRLAAAAQEAIARGEFGQAETLHHQVLAIHEKTLGPQNATTANSMSNLAYVYSLQ